jgi:hypothetical protein
MAYRIERMTSKQGKMVLHGEGRGNISSPHLVKYFGDQNPPQMRRYDLEWIIISFFIYICIFWVEKWKI